MTVNILPYASIYVNMSNMKKALPLVEGCCVPVLGPTLDVDEARSLATTLKVVADPARLRMLNMIAAAGEVCGCDLTGPLGLSQPTVSHHLKVMTEAGFLTREKRGRWAYHRIVPERLDDLSGALATAGATTPASR